MTEQDIDEWWRENGTRIGPNEWFFADDLKGEIYGFFMSWKYRILKAVKGDRYE